jgi:ribonuclease HII
MRCSLEPENAIRAQGYSLVAGVDEAGRGPLAGPVVAAAAILPADFHHPILRDSKKCTACQRDRLFEELSASDAILWATAIVGPDEIDRINILRATHRAMQLAVEKLSPRPDHVLIDGLPVPRFPLPQTALVKGDALSFSIAAASIFAKVTRDRLMLDYARDFPAYGFAQHKGYGTALHLSRLREYGPCPLHRRSFLPVQQALLPFG